MILRRRPDTVARILIRLIVLVALYQVGLHAMDRLRVPESLLAPGAHVPFAKLFLGMVFVLLRLYVVVLLPGVTLAQLIQVISARRAAARSGPRTSTPAGPGRP